MRHAQLKAFHSVASHGGFSRAAEALNMTQPALSEQVRRLEQEHDTLLFHRAARAVRLTEAGEGLLVLTKRYFEAEGAIAAHLDEGRAAVAGRLRIVADSARQSRAQICQTGLVGHRKQCPLDSRLSHVRKFTPFS